MVELGRFIRSDITASAIGHLSVLALVLIFAEVRPFGRVTAETIAVDIVSPDETRPTPKDPEPPKPQSSDVFDSSAKPAAAASPVPARPQTAATAPQKQAAPSTPRPDRQQAVAQPQPPATSPAPTAVAQPQPPPTSPASTYTPPEPDLSLKYHVMLGLPQAIELPPPNASGKPGEVFDDQAAKAADISSSLVAEFRRHLKTCSKLPATIAASDKIIVKLRVLMTLQGKLAAQPLPIEGSASVKALALAQGAISALTACQPYPMLPADRYGEWKVLDLTFTPQDFAGG